MPNANKAWFYSHSDIDGGTRHRRTRDGEMLDLVIKKMLVSRSRLMLWKRNSYNSKPYKEDFADRFHFHIYSHPITGAFYQRINGRILWRDWYEYVTHPSGARMKQSCDDPELIAVQLDGDIVYGADIDSR